MFIMLCLSSAPKPQSRSGYPPVAPKPSAIPMATGGAGPQEAEQESPLVTKKMIPVQSSRPPAAASVGQQGELMPRCKSFPVS